MKWLPGLLLAACSAPLLPPSSTTVVDESCQRALADLKADKMNGFSCSEAKVRTLAKEPLCPLKFTCGVDGGVE